MNESNGVIRDARKLGIPKMLILGLQHMFAMFGATILVPILVNSYFVDACGEGPSRGLTVSVTLFCAGFGTLLFHLCAKFKVPAFLGSSFAFLSGFAAVANLNTGKYANMSVNDKAAYACGGIVVAGILYFQQVQNLVPQLKYIHILFSPLFPFSLLFESNFRIPGRKVPAKSSPYSFPPRFPSAPSSWTRNPDSDMPGQTP